MLNPSIDELLKRVPCKYELVSLTASRAREMQENNEAGVLSNYQSHKYVGKALEEIQAGKLFLKNKLV